jgi:hypothetical protein
MRKQLFKFLQIVLLLLLLGSQQIALGWPPIKPPKSRTSTNLLPRGSWSQRLERSVLPRIGSNTGTTIGLSTSSEVPFGPAASTIPELPTPRMDVFFGKLHKSVVMPENRDLAKVSMIHDFEPPRNLSYTPSLSPELIKPVFDALVCTFKIEPSIIPLWRWRVIGWLDELQRHNIPANQFANIPTCEYIVISSDMVFSHLLGEEVIFSHDYKYDSLFNHDNELPRHLLQDENIVTLGVELENCSRILILERASEAITTPTIRLEQRRYKMPANLDVMSLYAPQGYKGINVEAKQSYSNGLELKKQNGTTNELSVPISTPINDSDWWLEYIKHKIEEQMIKLGMQIQFDFKIEEDTVGYIIYIYGYEYKLDAA